MTLRFFVYALLILLYSTPCVAGFDSLKFSGAQIADMQWNVGSCIDPGSNGCQIYSKSPGPTWNTGNPVYPSTTQYIAFTATGDSTDPWHMYLYNSNGSVAQDLGTGHILSEGTGADGHNYFFFSNADYNGTLFSTDWGMNNSNGLIITGTMFPTVSQTNAFASTGSTTPLAAGQTAGPAAPPVVPGLCCGGSAAQFNANSTNTAKVMNFVARPTNDSQVNITQIGNQNTVTVTQTGTKNNKTSYAGNGSNNQISVTQSGTGQTQTNYVDLTVTGNQNYVSVTQNSTGGTKGTFANVQNDNNRLTVQQSDDGNHYANVSLSGGNKSVDITQSGPAGHMADISLSGQAASVSLTQTGSTQQFYSIQFNCGTAGGCAPIQVRQGN